MCTVEGRRRALKGHHVVAANVCAIRHDCARCRAMMPSRRTAIVIALAADGL